MGNSINHRDALDEERAARIQEVMAELAELNLHVPVVVEGQRDKQALRKLGLTGEIITLYQGSTLYEFAEDIAMRFPEIVLLMDWDHEGQRLQDRLGQELSGLWERHDSHRRMLKILCQKDIKDMEGIPSLLRRLEGAKPQGD